MTLLKIFSVLLGLIVITKTLHDFKKKNESLMMLFFWLIIWIIIIILALFPIMIDRITSLLGDTGNGVNTFLGAAFVFLLFITYRVYAKANRLERQMHDMVMKLGLRDIEKE